ncbi:Transposase IS116/IS110/IS902 family protein [Micromonospora viridifaciens]|uniref:Transposase IS116/IS110/IS902 family protein n=1 Tax=Micromonospora viridifaciens TaxID=1881 RepID=A0A1C4YJU6_MICVI|nr:IS110 family transposase [Micromonospora viridifaciens]SCF20601.1 Transposase IS116/IS110/IS902 family protein [Micromonospora viridifaciens]
MAVFCGIDWSEEHHDVAVVDADGNLVARRRISDDVAGFRRLVELLVEVGDSAEDPVPVAIETSRGLLVSCLRATGRSVFAINPMAVARYRERHVVSRKKSDHADAVVLANILRTDMAVHRPLPADSELARAIAVLARAQQDAVWDRTQAHNKLRSLLREYYPAFLAAFRDVRGGIMRPEARAVLAAAPTPAQAADLTCDRLAELLRQSGRQRGVAAEAARLRQVFTAEYLRQPPLVEKAMGRQALALLRALDAACVSADELATAAEKAFDKHPDAEIITSFAGLGRLTGARVLAEIGDDRSRFADAKAVKAYAGSAPVTRASGKSHIVLHRRVKNQRLATTGYQWAFSALTASPGARRHYQRRRAAGDAHTAALRNLFNRLLGCLHHCLQTGQFYQEHIAFAPLDQRELPAAA